MTINSLSQTNSIQVRQLLENCGVTIKKEISGRFEVVCPQCQSDKKYAFIEFKNEKRWLKCNRNNNCGYNQSLWDLVAEKQGLSTDDKHKMLECINNILGQEFVSNKLEEPMDSIVIESSNEDQEFLIHCNQIFKNAFKQDTEEVQISWEYLRSRNYNDEQINSFNLGYLPDSKELLQILTSTPYSYTKSEANDLMKKYFEHMLSWNARFNQPEKSRSRIAFTWHDKNNNISGFSFRKATNKDVPMKYVFNKEAPRSRILFNINNWTSQENKKLVIVEGTFDALSANYLSSKEVQSNYFFVAMGGSSLTQGQAELLKSYNIEAVILFIDSDTGGTNYPSSVRRLEECNITAAIARIPKEYKNIKDIDELLRKYPDSEEVNIMNILEEAKVETEQESVATIEVPEALTPEEITEQRKRTIELQEQLKEKKPIDSHLLKRTVDHARKEELYTKLATNIKTKPISPDILKNVQEYNNLLATNYDSDKPYGNKNFLSDLSKSVDGLKTGFKTLDKYITIQQSTISFIAGRPGHGKTTMMINMMRNMIRANPEQAFLFYSYEESHVDIMLKIILSCTKGKDSELAKEKDSNTGNSYFARAKKNLKEYAVAITEDAKGTILSCATNLHEAYKEVESWVSEGRLQIMTRKPNIESLSGAIIERVQAVEMKYIDEDSCPQMEGKKVAAIFVDYVQKLNTEEDKVTRQQELQKICEDLLILSTDKRVEAAFIMGAQVNRTANSLDTLLLETMREAGDIENIANIVIGVWDEEAGLTERAQELLSNEIQRKIKDEIKNKGFDINQMKTKIIEMTQNAYDNHSEETSESKKLTFKILKNRNGQSDRLCKANIIPERFCITDIENENKNKNKTDYDREAEAANKAFTKTN